MNAKKKSRHMIKRVGKLANREKQCDEYEKFHVVIYREFWQRVVKGQVAFFTIVFNKRVLRYYTTPKFLEMNHNPHAKDSRLI